MGVYSKLQHNVRGYILVKDFIVVGADKGLTVRQANEQRYAAFKSTISHAGKLTNVPESPNADDAGAYYGDSSSAGPFHHLVCVPPTMHMLDVLNKFQDNKKHIALVTDKPEVVEDMWKQNKEIPPDIHMAGILTLEDIIEKLLQEDIEDEHDDMGMQKD